MSSISEESARNISGELVEKFNRSIKDHYTERDTIAIFILPFLEALGWDVHDVYEVRQGGFPYHLNKSIPVNYRSLKHPDCVISFNNAPHVILEFKRLAYGPVDRYCQLVVDLFDKAVYTEAKYAVLTSFTRTLVYDGTKIVSDDDSNTFYDGVKVYDASSKKHDCTKIEPLIRFSNPADYLSKFNELWTHLSKEKAIR